MDYSRTYLKLSDFGRELLDKTSLEEGLPFISLYIKDIVDAQRCSIFINDIETNELWTTLADGVEKIIIPSDKGIVGETIKTRDGIIVNDVYSNPNFLSKVDEETGFTTQNLITAPIFNSQKDVIGVLELLNKDGGFQKDDAKFMRFFAHYISGFLELINMYSSINKHHEKS